MIKLLKNNIQVGNARVSHMTPSERVARGDLL